MASDSMAICLDSLANSYHHNAVGVNNFLKENIITKAQEYAFIGNNIVTRNASKTTILSNAKRKGDEIQEKARKRLNYD